MQKLSTSVHLHVDILRATVKHKVHFMDLVNSNEYLRLVELSEWAGMGGVRFVPLGWDDFPLEQTKTELNKLNIDLVESLKTTDSAFSMGEGLDGLICVRFGMVTHETDIEELLDLVVSVGKTVQENSRVLDNMSVIVKKVKMTIITIYPVFGNLMVDFRALRPPWLICNESLRRSFGRRAFSVMFRCWAAWLTGGHLRSKRPEFVAAA